MEETDFTVIQELITNLAYAKEENKHISDEQPIDFGYVHGFEDGLKEAMKMYNNELYNKVWKSNHFGEA